MTILWSNFDWGKNVFVYYCDRIGKKCLKAEFTREIAQFLFCYKIWWYLRHEGIQEMANDRWIKHFRHSRASWVIQLALWRRLATTTSEVDKTEELDSMVLAPTENSFVSNVVAAIGARWASKNGREGGGRLKMPRKIGFLGVTPPQRPIFPG